MPIEVTELGIVTDVSPLQLWNTPLPIEVTELGIITEVSPLQLSNAEFPIEVTELGIVTDVSPLQDMNALPAIIFVPSFMLIDVLSGIVPLYLNAILPIYINPSGRLSYHAVPLNASALIEITDSGIVTEVRLLQLENAPESIVVTEFGIITEVSPLQP